MQLISQVESVLEKGGFNYCKYDGCFDIAARRKFTIFIKVLGNVDSIQEDQAKNLKIISDNFDATVAIVGLHTRREMLRNSIIYERFEIPTFTPQTLEDIIVNDSFPYIYRSRGGLFVEINPDSLRYNREKAGLTQSELADKVGINKKSVYEHEHSGKKALIEHVERIEKFVGNVREPINIHTNFNEDANVPKDGFENAVYQDFKKVGFAPNIIYKSPFNIIIRDSKIMILSKADENKKHIMKEAPIMANISDVMNMPAIAVTKEPMNLGIPSITESDLKGMSSAKELKKKIK